MEARSELDGGELALEPSWLHWKPWEWGEVWKQEK